MPGSQSREDTRDGVQLNLVLNGIALSENPFLLSLSTTPLTCLDSPY